MAPSIDSESDGQPDNDAGGPLAAFVGDDDIGADDEDGVTWEPLIAGTTPDVHVDSTGSGTVFIWIDKDGTGPLSNGDDRHGPFGVVAGNNDLTVDLTGYSPGDSFMRVRICDTPVSIPPIIAADCRDPTGHSLSGEVEDYKVKIIGITTKTAVGGIFEPIDTTAVLIAGAQSNALSILAGLMVIGAVAFGALYVSVKRKHN